MNCWFNEIVGDDSLTSVSRLVGNIKICKNPGSGGWCRMDDSDGGVRGAKNME